MKAIYVRQSVDKKDSISIESQVDFCRRMIDPDDAYKVYEDKGYSGKNTQRPSLQKLMADIRSGSVSHVVVYKIDRISRSLLDFSGIIETFRSHSVEFISSTEKFDTSSPIGMAMLSIIMVFAELERKTIQQRITDNYYQRGKTGSWLGGPAPYGYRNRVKSENGKNIRSLEVESEESDVVKRIYELYSKTNISLNQLAKKLNQEGIATKKGGNWSGDMIGKLIRNPIHVCADADVYVYFAQRGCQITNSVNEYNGTRSCMLYGKRSGNQRKYTDIKGHRVSLFGLNGLISSPSWLACQYKLDRNQQIGRTGQGKHTWLSGIIKCKKCGYAMVCVKRLDELYLHCSNKRNKGVCSGQSTTQHVARIEAVVESAILRRSESVKNFPATEANTPMSYKINQIKQELITIEEEVGSLVESLRYMKGASASIVGAKINELDEQRGQLIEKMEKGTEKAIENTKQSDVYEDIINWKNLDIDSKRAYAGALITSVMIDDNTIDIKWRALSGL